MTEITDTLRSAMRSYDLLLRKELSNELEEADGEELTRCAVRLRSVMDHTESGRNFDRAHEILDQVGRLRRENFPELCALDQSNGQYSRTCPVDLAHVRVGLSPGFVIRAAECSICKEDPRDCAHIKGETYDGERCVRIITKLDLLEISLVDTPSQPEARLHSISVSKEELKRDHPNFQDNAIITCNACLADCRGLSRPYRNEV